MCGIVVAPSHDVGERMLDLIQHRGRDFRQLHELPEMGLWIGVNRLAIVDSHDPFAQQPLLTEGQALAFNGEIYNRRELYRLMLQDQEVKPNDAAEVEVINALLQRHPGNFDRFLDGYYAFVHVDRKRRTVTLARDLVGVIPLFYTTRPDLRVCSERKGLGTPCLELQPGEVVTLIARNGGWRVLRQRRWEPASLHLEPMDHFHLQMLFERAVLRRIEHSERPVCLALSGGLDSSLIAVAAARHQHYLHCITVCLDRDGIEATNAVELCRQLGVPHDLVVITPDQIRVELPAIVAALDDPIPNKIKRAAMVRNWFVAKHAPGIVILCGEGADELGGGYPSHQACSGLQLEWKTYSTVRSMHAINLDRVNLGGMAHTREYRTPFLDRALLLYCLGCRKARNKEYFRQLAQRYGIPGEIIWRTKYSNEEEVLWSIVAN